MGCLRLFLALTVLDWHYRFANPRLFPFSYSAVCCFFVISGFYMSLVINEKYGTTALGLRSFYANRALRLYPINVAVLAALVLTGYFGLTEAYGPFLPSVPMPLSERLTAILNQVLIFPNVLLQNLLLLPTADYDNLVFGQLYTVGLEIMFYSIAPLIVTRSARFLCGFALVAALFHFGLHGVLALPSRPWQYEFFPGVLIFFLMGCLSYRLLVVIRTWHYRKLLGLLSLPVFLLYCLWAHNATVADFTNGPKVFGLYVLTMVMVPFLFQASSSSYWDRLIGDLSYPLYAIHYLVGLIFVGVPGTGSPEQAMKVLLASLVGSVLLLLCVDYPIERVRRRLAAARPARISLNPQPG